MSEVNNNAPIETNGVSARLTREAGIIGARLARFLSAARLHGDAVKEAQEFLNVFFESVSPGPPLAALTRSPLDRRPAGVTHPIDRLVERLALSAVEVELLLLGGLCEEHEGLASILRLLHPRGEPRASVGLAVQLLSEEHFDRNALRVLLETSAVVRSGALHVTGDGPFFERSLHLPEALWSALHGIDVWPQSVRILNGPIATVGLEEWFATSAVRRAAAAIERGQPCTVVVTGDNDDTAFERARALVVKSGATPVGILLPAAAEPGFESLIQVH